MSVVKYRNVLYQFSKEIDWQNERERIIFICQGFLPDGFVDDITDVISLLTKLEENNLLGIDRLYVLKELLKKLGKWDLIRMVERFEVKRKDYKQLLEKMSRALDESSELQRLISICRRQNLIAHEREEHILNVHSLFTELEQQNNLGIENLTILKSLATEVEKPDLCKLVEEFEKKRKQEDDAEREGKEWEERKRRAQAQAASVLTGGINIGERVIGVVTPHCTFRNLTGGAVVVTTWMVLRRSPSMEEFVTAFKEAVLPFGNCLRAIGEGSIRFTIQAENVSALDALWRGYQDEILQTKLKEFLVTEEIKQLAGGEVTLTVQIDEDEYRNAKLDLMISETEEMKLEEKRGFKDRASSDSDLLIKRNMTTENANPYPEREFLPFDRRHRVEEYLENLHGTLSEIILPSDSGEGTWSGAPSEYEFDKGDIIEKLDQANDFIRDTIGNWRGFQHGFKYAYPLEGPKFYKMEKEMEGIRITLETLKEMEKKWMNAEPILTSSNSAEAIIQQLENSLPLHEGFIRNPSTRDKKAIRGLARKAKSLKRVDVFEHLRRITPAGTTGPRFYEDLDIEQIPANKRWLVSFLLKVYVSGNPRTLELLNWSPSDVHTLRMEINSLDNITKRYGLRTVGELYDFLADRGLAHIADKL